MNKTRFVSTMTHRSIRSFIRPTMALPMIVGAVVGCGAQDASRPEAIETSNQSLSGTVAFGETAVAPVSVTAGVSKPLAMNYNDLRVRAVVTVPNESVVYIGGEFSFYVGAQKFANLAKFTIPNNPSSPLVLDQAFHPVIDRPVWAVAATSAKVYVGGEFTNVNATPRAGLAALNATDGALDTAFISDVNLAEGSCVYSTSAACRNPPQNAANGVHALALAPIGDRAGTKQLIVGGNFKTIKGSPRSGLASVSVTDGSVYTGYFATGVDGFVQTLKPDGGNWVYVGGYFLKDINGVERHGLMKTSRIGAILSMDFIPSGSVIDLDIDNSTSRILAATNGNTVDAISSQGGGPIWSVYAQGDVHTVHYFGGNVYFGFHDGLFVDGSNATPPAKPHAGDQYKLAAINSQTGALLNDKVHTGPCDATNPGNCWAPETDSANKPVESGNGFWGLWAIETYTTSSGTRLLVGGEVNTWGSVSSKLLTSFDP